jgi:hypothetical protein
MLSMSLDPLDGQVLLLLPKTVSSLAFISEMDKKEVIAASILLSHQRFNKIQHNNQKNQNQTARIQKRKSQRMMEAMLEMTNE